MENSSTTTGGSGSAQGTQGSSDPGAQGAQVGNGGAGAQTDIGGTAQDDNLPRNGDGLRMLALAGLALFLGGVAIRFGEPGEG